MTYTVRNLIDDICGDNDYLLTFQATDEARNFAKELINLRDNKTTDLSNLKYVICQLIDTINIHILNTDDECNKDYLNEILDGVLKSQQRCNDFVH